MVFAGLMPTAWAVADNLAIPEPENLDGFGEETSSGRRRPFERQVVTPSASALRHR